MLPTISGAILGGRQFNEVWATVFAMRIFPFSLVQINASNSHSYIYIPQPCLLTKSFQPFQFKRKIMLVENLNLWKKWMSEKVVLNDVTPLFTAVLPKWLYKAHQGLMSLKF